ncbi:hypothetical protein [Paraburkholderia fungorum]|uniref:Uncharacterized protein n=1 Tax=Paraburkholderia fungorum TaxID=134537 RepID=A0AAW3V2U0_9BURK|nr:hypothetical protein [Paraburkholderia fungorum]MBB4517178.1 hypothetical protein [Paraburkholderia fungorum]MBB6204246.1 hypothetical protein [Paraburkholderia fungorum]
MSTQIHTGFKFVQRELGSIVEAMEAVRGRIETLQRQRYLQAYAGIFVEVMDRSRHAIATGRTEGMVSARPASLVRRAIAKRQQHIRATRERDPAVDLEVVLTCWHSQRLAEVVGCVFSEFSEPVLRLLKDADVATAYAYWNSSDPDRNVAPAEWAQRESVWKDVLARKSGMGFQFRFEGEHATLPVHWEEVAPHLPDLDTRVREIAVPALFQRWYVEVPDKREDKADIWQLHSQFRKRLREDTAAKRQLADETARLKPLLLSSEELGKARDCAQMLISPCND